MSDLKPIICLGLIFTTENERREHFRNELRKKLPELKKIDGFPIGEDEDIINLSDPPYYTACPNPWLNDFIAEWEKEKEHIPGRKKDFHVDEPYASDVSEGKYHPLYLKHPYHTKVPHIAIMKYLLHYTQPGDIVLDPFAGTGMTGVASQIVENPDLQTKALLENELLKQNHQFKWGKRFSICGDLSPAASFIAYNYNYPLNVDFAESKITNILDSISREYEWMFETNHPGTNKKGKINFVIWSDVFFCGNCSDEVVFWDDAVDVPNGIVLEEFHCPHCKSLLTKKNVNRKFRTFFDQELQQTVRQSLQIPVEINYSFRSKKFKKKPDKDDLDLIEKIEGTKIKNWFPLYEIKKGEKTGEPLKLGLNYVHQLYSKRNLIILSDYASQVDHPALHSILTAVAFRITKRYALTYQSGSWGAGGGPTNGTYYIPSLVKELNIQDMLGQALKKYLNGSFQCTKNSLITTQSATLLKLANNSVDYIFVDPPFGSNLIYSELNMMWESWLKLFTQSHDEAIECKAHNKDIFDYRDLMLKSFKECFRVLRPGKWMTVEFSNTKASVWNTIQYCIQNVGFVIANVSALDKQKGSFNAQVNPISVKQDLVISCYKPSEEFEKRFNKQGYESTIWDFVLEHLRHLPVHVKKDNATSSIVERSSKVIYDRLISFYLMKGLTVPIDSKDFQEGLRQRFIERDGMYFTSEQAAEYDEKKAKAPQFVQFSLIVTNESDAIEWLKDRLRKQPQKYQDIMPDFRIATQSLRKGDTLPELQDILYENFIQEADGRWRTPDPNEAKDREALRTKVLLKEFNGYVAAINQPRAKKLKEVRVESLRAGFKNCWGQKDFKTIVTLGDMIPQNILLEDEQLLMYYDIAKDRV